MIATLAHIALAIAFLILGAVAFAGFALRDGHGGRDYPINNGRK